MCVGAVVGDCRHALPPAAPKAVGCRCQQALQLLVSLILPAVVPHPRVVPALFLAVMVDRAGGAGLEMGNVGQWDMMGNVGG